MPQRSLPCLHWQTQFAHAIPFSHNVSGNGTSRAIKNFGSSLSQVDSLPNCVFDSKNAVP